MHGNRATCPTWLALSVVSASLLTACDTTRPTAYDPTASGRTPQSRVFAMGSSGKPTRSPLPDAPFSFAAGVACTFPLIGTVVENKEVSNTFPTEPNGDVVTHIAGRLVMDITNGNTNKSIEVNISGPGTIVTHVDGSVTFTGLGRSLFFFTPTSIPVGPITFIYSGKTVVDFTASGQATLISQSGNAQDVCAALS
jgi:hypothetical protein